MFLKNKILLIVALLFLTSCVSYTTSNNKYLIGVILSLTGKQGDQGMHVLDGIKLSVRNYQKNQNNNIDLLIEDDKSDPTTATEIATKMVHNPKIIAIIGTINSSTALVSLPILNRASIPLISTSNGMNQLTLGDGWKENSFKRVYNNYFRVVANDRKESNSMVNYVTNILKYNSIAIVNDNGAYGVDVSDSLIETYKQLNKSNNIKGTFTINSNETDYSSVVNSINNLNVDMVFYGGQYNEMALLSYELKSKGFKGSLFGANVYDNNYISIAKENSNNDYSTALTLDINDKKLNEIHDIYYSSHLFKEDIGPYTYISYDLTDMLCYIINNVVRNKEDISSLRKRMIKNIQTAQYKGFTGEISFDTYGDINNPIINIYKVINSNWVSVK